VLPPMFDPFAMHVSIPRFGILEIAGIQAPMRGLLSGARNVCSIPFGKSQCVEVGSVFAAGLSGQCALKLSIFDLAPLHWLPFTFFFFHFKFSFPLQSDSNFSQHRLDSCLYENRSTK